MGHNSVMSSLQLLRQSKQLARWVLVWFALSLTAAIAAPVVNPQGLTLVCTAAGQVKLVSADSAQNADAAMGLHPHLDCVLCLALDVPPTPAAGAIPAPLAKTISPSGRIRVWTPQPHVQHVSARGPPAAAAILFA